MSYPIKNRFSAAVESFRRQFADQPTQALGSILPSQSVHQALAQFAPAFRQRVYPPLTTLSLFIGQALSPDGSCQDAVARMLSARAAQGLPGCSLSSGPYCKARQRLPLALIDRLLAEVAERLERQSPKDWRWRGRSLKLVDGTTVSMPDTASNQQAYQANGAQKPGQSFPQARLVAILSLSTGAVLHWAHGPCKGKGTGELSLFRTLMPYLKPGQIALADCYYSSYFTVAQLMAQGVDLVMGQHAQRRTDFRDGQSLGPGDHIVQWLRPAKPQWMDAQTYAGMPRALTLRETKWGEQVIVSSLTDARSVSAAQLGQLYRWRWQVEVDLRSIKTQLGMDVLRSQSAAMVEKEIAVYLLAYNLICALMVRAAAGAGLTARALSFTSTKQLYLHFEQQLRHAAHAQAKRLIAYVLGGISTLTLTKRPGRVEPRAVKRRPKKHCLLKMSRAQAREAILSARQAKYA